ncbi:thioredoxin family protein [Melioribacter sp. Ez-97]|jgi:thioredoxin 1|uniref:thioredoxin family protein n=1 Tax=Melioribacter sp. Ez-97 TaxID=3423434 RepID=UPI003ED8EFBD
MLHTNLTHVLSKDEHSKLLQENENVMICCGRMGPMCIPVYEVMEELENEYPHVKFADMEFDLPDASVIRDLPECRNFAGLPFVVYYKNGKVVKATSSIQTRDQITAILDEHFGKND